MSVAYPKNEWEQGILDSFYKVWLDPIIEQAAKELGYPSKADIDKAMASIPKPTCYADYGKTYRILPGGEVEEIKQEQNDA